jgi:hypothetical protein
MLWVGRPAVTQSSACCICQSGGLVDHPRQHRCSNTDGVSQPRTLRSALGQDILRSGPAGPVRIETLLAPPRGRPASGRRRPAVVSGGAGATAGADSAWPACQQKLTCSTPAPSGAGLPGSLLTWKSARQTPLDLFVALLDPVAQPIQAHHLGQVGLLGLVAKLIWLGDACGPASVWVVDPASGQIQLPSIMACPPGWRTPGRPRPRRPRGIVNSCGSLVPA